MSKPVNPNWLKLKNPKIIYINKNKDGSNTVKSTIDPIKQLEPILKDSRDNSLFQRIEKKK